MENNIQGFSQAYTRRYEEDAVANWDRQSQVLSEVLTSAMDSRGSGMETELVSTQKEMRKWISQKN